MVRGGIEAALALVGIGFIFASVLLGSPINPQLQWTFLLVGVLILEARVWGITSRILRNKRVYLDLREEGELFIGLIRKLNHTALARDDGHEHDERFRHTLEEMHASVERMSELAGQATDP